MNNKKIVDEDFWELIDSLSADFHNIVGFHITSYSEAERFITKTYYDKHKPDLNALRQESNSKIYVSERTLREYWPIDKTKQLNHIPSNRVLDIISECLGYASWSDYCNIQRRNTINEYSFFNPSDYKVDEMKENYRFYVGWFPIYYVEFEYLGKYQFKIISHSYNIRKKYRKGEIVTAYGFGLHYLYNMDNTTQNSKAVEGYPLFPTIMMRQSPDTECRKEGAGVFVLS